MVTVAAQRHSIILFLLAVLLLPMIAHAASFSLVVTPTHDEIWRNESATYDITISNFGTDTAKFQAYTIDPLWNIKVTPLDLTADPKSPLTFQLALRPSTTANSGPQGVDVIFKDLVSGTTIHKTIAVTIKTLEGGKSYVPNVGIDDVSMLNGNGYDIDPRQPIPIRLLLNNRNPLNITGLQILISSPHFTENKSVNLAPNSERTIDIDGVSISPTTAPGDADLIVRLTYQGSTVTQVSKNYHIIDYTQIRQSVKEQTFFFKTDKTVTVTNDGNVKNAAVVSIPTSFVKSLFISSSLPYEYDTKDGQRVVEWSLPLEPDGTASVTYTENYRILILIVILAIIGGILYFVLRSPVVMVKEAVAIARGEGISDIKVRLFVKNRSAKLIQAIQVTDKVPSLADVIRNEAPGSLPPSKIATNEKQGTLLRWDLEVLEPFEERVLTYQMKSKLKIIGRMKLPNARVRFSMNGKDRAVFSNNIELVEHFKDK